MSERKLTGAHYGLRDWAMQRITAAIIGHRKSPANNSGACLLFIDF